MVPGRSRAEEARRAGRATSRARCAELGRWLGRNNDASTSPEESLDSERPVYI